MQESSDLLTEAIYEGFSAGEYLFMVDKSMELDDDTMIAVLGSYYKIMRHSPEEKIDEELKEVSIKYISWVNDVGVHNCLGVVEKNCIIIKKNKEMYKFIKFFEKNKEELIIEHIRAQEDE